MLIIKIKDCKVPVKGGAISSFVLVLCGYCYFSSLFFVLFSCRFHIYLLPPFRCFLQKLKYVTMKLNLNFKLLSLNVREIRSIEKRKAIFNWLVKSKSDIRFLQET